MANISQHIPNYIKGISSQPDELKMPGQVRDAQNAIPDVTGGLIKRPGARLINPLGFDPKDGINGDNFPGTRGTTAVGTWFDFYIDRDESYIGKISPNGIVEIWNTHDGYPRVVKYDPSPQDFSSESDGLPASNSCDSVAYKAARDALSTTTNRINELEVGIDAVQTEWDNYDEPVVGGTPARYEAQDFIIVRDLKYTKIKGYIVDSGVIEDEENDDFTLDINPPEADSQQGNIAVADTYAASREVWERYKDDYINGYALAFKGAKVNIYDWDTIPVDTNAPSVSQDELQLWKDELATLEQTRIEQRQLMVIEAARCGGAQDPSPMVMSVLRDSDQTDNILPYLKFRQKDDLQTLTTHGRVLVVNRKVPVTLSSEIESVRPAEGYVEVKGLAGGRTYAFGVDLQDVDLGFTTMRASKLEVSRGVGWYDDSGGGTCIYQDTKVYQNITNNKGGKNLTFELTTTGSSRVKNPNEPEQGYECVYTTSIRLLNGGSGWKRGDQITVMMKDTDYQITIKETREEFTKDEVVIETGVFATDGDVDFTTKDVLNELKTVFDANATLQAQGFSCSIVGNGLYVSNDQGIPFALNSSEWDLLNCFGNQVTDVTQLPTQCKAGYVCKVANSDAEADDYYVQFYGTGGKPTPDGDITPKGGLPNRDQENYVRRNYGSDGPGAWYECVKPGLANILNSSSMPHQIRKIGGKSNTEFLVQPINWADREVGDDFTNPIPRFVGTARPTMDSNGNLSIEEDDVDLRYINNMIFYRSRLCFLCNEAIVMTQPISNIRNEQFNFWKKTATTLVDTDPIDLVVTSKNPAILYNSIITNSGLLLFSPNYQFLLSTNQDVLSPKTAEINEISSYRYNERTKPISMGTTVAFLSNAGVHSRLFEMTNIGRDQQAEVLEQSKIIADLIPNELNLLTHSKENQVVIAGSYLDNELFVYRYFNDGVQRKQAAWVRWELTGRLVYQSIIDDVLFLAVENNFDQEDVPWSVVTLQRIDLRESIWSAIVEDYSFINQDNQEGRYTVHMDNYLVVWPTQLQYYEHLDETYFRLPIGYFSDKRLAVYTLKYGKFQGRAAYPTIEIDNLGTWAVLKGDWSDTRMMLGYEFEYKVELPVIYPQKQEGDTTKSDITGSLILHRLNLSFGDHGVYETKLKRSGQDDYIQTYEARHEDGYLADDVAFDSSGIQVVPVYTRNTNFGPAPNGIFITSSHPAPCTLVSMTWEGDYTPKFYKRV